MASAKSLWADYLFLTKEMERFLQKEDYDMFFELMGQRERLQSQIDDCQDDFRLTAEGRTLITDMRSRNMMIVQRMQAVVRRMQHQQSVSNSYDGYGSGRLIGARLDSKL
jgi:hypothetical protein